jgi:hypothetical protein
MPRNFVSAYLRVWILYSSAVVDLKLLSWHNRLLELILETIPLYLCRMVIMAQLLASIWPILVHGIITSQKLKV